MQYSEISKHMKQRQTKLKKEIDNNVQIPFFSNG